VYVSVCACGVCLSVYACVCVYAFEQEKLPQKFHCLYQLPMQLANNYFDVGLQYSLAKP